MSSDCRHCSDCGAEFADGAAAHCCSFYDCFNWTCDACFDSNIDRLARDADLRLKASRAPTDADCRADGNMHFCRGCIGLIETLSS